MRPVIVPAVNTASRARAQAQLRLAERMGTWAQIDCADGQFVPHRTLSPTVTGGLSTTVQLELHLMVQDPTSWIACALRLGAKRVAFHIEAAADPRPFIAALRVHRITPVVAVRPDTALSALGPVARLVKSFLLLGVRPGRSGSRFLPATVRRVATLHKRYPRHEIGVDGGLNPATIPPVVRAGARWLVAGSDIFSSPNPVTEFRHLSLLR